MSPPNKFADNPNNPEKGAVAYHGLKRLDPLELGATRFFVRSCFETTSLARDPRAPLFEVRAIL